jgi:hypothetical protein
MSELPEYPSGANSPAPAFVKINYQSPWSPHTMQVPSVPITGVGSSMPMFNLRGGALSVNVDTAIIDFVNLVRPFYRENVTFIDALVFTQESENVPPVPVLSVPLNLAGNTQAPASWEKAVQKTWTWRTDAFGVFKIVMLDVISGNYFDPIRVLANNSSEKALSDYVTADVTWIAGRDGGRPTTFLQCATTLNEKLRSAYRMN